MPIKWTPSKPGEGTSRIPSSFFGQFNQTARLTPSIMAGFGSQQPGGGGNPYAGILSNYFNTMQAQAKANSVADAASRDAAIRRYVISYGDVPDFSKLGISGQTLGFLQGAINDNVRQLALQNTQEGTSVKSRLAHSNDIANRQIPATLAGRGLLHSGQTGYDLGEQAQNYKIQGFDTLNEMLGNIEGSVSGFLNAERQRQQELAMAEMQAAMAAAQTWGGSIYPAAGSNEPLVDRGTPTPVSPTASTYNPFAPNRKPVGGAGGGWVKWL